MEKRRLRAHRVLLAAFSFVAMPCAAHAQDGSWEERAPLLVPRRLLAAAAHEGRIYTFGGCGSPCFQPPFHTSTFEEKRVEVYDPVSNSWSVRAPMPTILFGAAAAAPGNDRIYVVGGYLTGNLTQEYDPATYAWALKAPMPTPRYGLAAVALGGKVYALGGSGPSGAVEVYDPETDSWSQRAPLTPRVFLAAAVLDGKIYALGGSPDCCGGARTAAVEVYDPAADAWSAAAPLPVALQLSAAAALGGKLYAFGGFIPGQGAQAGTFVYDPATGAWASGPPLPVLRGDRGERLTGRDQAPAVVVGECVHVVGGSVSCHCQALADHRCFRDGAEPADLAIRKSDGVGRICPGEPVTYRIEVLNHGPAAVTGARVRDDFPSALTGVAWSCTAAPGAACEAASGGDPLDELVDLPAGGSVVYTVAGTVAPGFCGRLVNTAAVEPPAEVPDPDLSNNQATDSDAPRGVDLRIEKSNGVDRVTAGERVTYTILVENPSMCPTSACVHDDSTPPLTDASWACAPSQDADCTRAGVGQIDDCDAFLPPDGVLTYTVTGVVAAAVARVSPAAGGAATLCNAATVEAACDAEPANDRAEDCDPIVPCETDLAIAAAPAALSATAGEAVEFAWVVTNEGSSPVAGAAVHAEPPAVFAGDPAWSCAPAARCTPAAGSGAVDATVALAPGESVTITVEGTLRADLFCAFLAVATVAPPAGCADSDPGDDQAVAELTVFPPPPGMRACKSVSGDLRAGGVVRYRIVLLNPGPFAQGDNQGSELVDALPPALTGIEATASAGEVRIDGRTVIWNGAVPAGGTVTIDITAMVDADAGALEPPLCNRGKVFTDPDGDGDNDDASATDDPRLPGESDPTCLDVLAPLEIPTLPTAGLLALALLLAAAGLVRLWRGGQL